jgi:hypothetical protein
VFTIEDDEAVLITWSPDQAEMATTRWSRSAGLRSTTRAYP